MVISTIQSVSHTQNLKNDLCYNFIPAPGTLTAGQKAASAVFSKDWLFTIHRTASPLYVRRHRARAQWPERSFDILRIQESAL